MRGRERVAVGARARACALVRHPGGEALVVGLDRHVQQLGQLVGEGPAQRGLLALLPREGGGQADDDPLCLLPRDQLGDGLRVGGLDRLERPHEGSGRVRDRAAAAGGAVIECEHPQEAIE